MLAKCYDQKSLKQFSHLVTKAIESCTRLPLAIAIITGLELESEEDWRNAVHHIERQDIDISPIDYQFNLYGTFNLSIQKLSDENKSLLSLLVIFKRVPIPIESIMAIWRKDKFATKSILNELCNKSLLTCSDTER